jgi:hypothetical protein
LSDSNASLGAGQYLNYVATISQKVTKYSKKFCGQRVAGRSVARHELPQGSAKSASVLSQFAATYSQKCVTAKRAKSNKNFIDEHLLYKFRHS